MNEDDIRKQWHFYWSLQFLALPYFAFALEFCFLIMSEIMWHLNCSRHLFPEGKIISMSDVNIFISAHHLLDTLSK